MSKEELERLKQQLKEEEEKRKLEEEIAAIRARIDNSIKTQEQLDRSRSKAVSVLKTWLQQTGYWFSFLLMVPGIVLVEIGTVTGFLILMTIGGLMLVGGILFTPFLRPVWDTSYKPPSSRAKR